MGYGFKKLAESNLLECPVPRAYLLKSIDDSLLSFEEDLGDETLQVILQEEEDHYSIMQECLETVANLHARWQRLETYDVGKEKIELAKTIGRIANLIMSFNRPELTENDKKLLREVLTPICEKSMQRISIIEGNIISPIHADLHPGHMFKVSGGFKVADLSRVSRGPVVFDLLDLLHFPLVNLDSEKRENLLHEYLGNYYQAVTRFSGGLTYPDAGIIPNLEFSNEFLNTAHILSFPRLLRGAEKSALLKYYASIDPRFKDVYLSAIKSNKFYPLYPLHYLAKIGDLFDHLKENSRKIGLTKASVQELERTLCEYLPEIKSQKPAFKDS